MAEKGVIPPQLQGKTFDTLSPQKRAALRRKGAETRRKNAAAKLAFKTLLESDLNKQPPLYFRSKYAHLYSNKKEKPTLKTLLLRAWVDAAMCGNQIAMGRILDTEKEDETELAQKDMALGVKVIKEIFGTDAGNV